MSLLLLMISIKITSDVTQDRVQLAECFYKNGRSVKCEMFTDYINIYIRPPKNTNKGIIKRFQRSGFVKQQKAKLKYSFDPCKCY